MAKGNDAIAIIPSDSFRWRPRVQFIESFRTRAAALSFAFQHGYNLIVERNEGRTRLFDVLLDPDGACTAGLDLEMLKTEDVLVEPPSAGWTTLTLWAVWDLVKGLVALVAGLYVRQFVPRSRRVADAARIYFREVAPLSRRTAVVARAYLREAGPLLRRAVGRLWWSDGALALRRVWHRHSHGTACDFAKRFAAIGSRHLREIVPRSCHAAGRLRRAWASSLLAGCDLALRLCAAAASLSHREITVIFRYAARCWPNSMSDLHRHAWAVVAARHPDPSQHR